MELNFEERVAELERLLGQRQEDLSNLVRERKEVEKKLKVESALQMKLQHKLNAASCEKANLLLALSRSQKEIRDEEECLQSALRSRKWQEEVAFKNFCNSRKIMKIFDEEEERVTRAKAILLKSTAPIEKRAARMESTFKDKKQVVNQASQALRDQKVRLTKTKRLFEDRKCELDNLKAHFDAQRIEINTTKSKARESSHLNNQHNKRARSELLILKSQCEDLRRIEKNLDERYSLLTIFKNNFLCF